MADNNGWNLMSVKPKRYGHYLVLSDMNWYHGGCFDLNSLTWDKISRPEAPAETTLSLHVAFYDGTDKWSWNDPYALAWHELPEIPQEFIDHNKDCIFYDVGVTNDPALIRMNPNAVAINSAIEVDLTGQICADSIGDKIFSSVGGQHDFMYGASLSEGGKTS